MKLSELLASLTQRTDLRFLLIGGHAVIAHGYARTTFDVDLLVCRDQSAEWTGELESLGYKPGNQARGFKQFAAPPGGDPVDLMLVNASTFEGMWRTARIIELDGHAVRIPALDHLLALKLHVLKQNLGHRVIKDLDDVIQLTLANRLPIETDHYKKLFAKYGTIEDYDRVLKAIGRN